MFNIGIGELLIVLVVAFVIVGPDDLPKVARWLGKQVGALKRMIREIKAETGWDDLEREVRDIQRDVKDTVKQMDVSAELKGAVKDAKVEVEGAVKDVKDGVRELDKEVRAAQAAAKDDRQEETKNETGNH